MKRSVVLVLVLSIATLAAAPGASGASGPFAHGCPPEGLEEGSVARLNRNPTAKKAMVPAGATSVRICRYYGFGEFDKQTPKTRARVGRLRDQRVARGRGLLESLRLEFQELEAAPKGPISCPADEGAELYAVFSYRHAKPVFVEVHLSGCEFAVGGPVRARWSTTALRKRLVRLVEGKKAPPHSTHGGVKEKSAVAFPPAHLSIAQAEHSAKEDLEFFCEESGLCESQSTGPCTRKNAAAIGCRYTATLKSGEVCRGTLRIKALGEGAISNTPGLLSTDEGECFYLFAPPELKELEEEREKKG